MALPLPEADDLRQLQKIEADRDRTLSVIDELVAMGTRRFQFSANGEPFLHSHALEFMDRAKKSGAVCVVNTNGTLLNSAVMDELVRMAFDELQVTTMAGNTETYERTHPFSGRGEFDRIRKNLLYLAERKAASGAGLPKVSLCFVVVKQNCHDICDLARFAASVRADQVLFRAFFDVNDPHLAGLVPTSAESASIKEQMKEVHSFLDREKIKNNIGNFLNVFGRKLDTQALYRLIPCYYGWLSTVIDTEGTVYFCCRCHSPLGNVNERGFRDIWYGENYSRSRREAGKLNVGKKPLLNCSCSQCANWNANLRSYKILHPLKGRSDRLKRVCPSPSGEII